MTPTQLEALTRVVDSQEKLQEAFNRPRTFKLSEASSLQAHVVTIVAQHQDGILVWSSAIRLFNPKKKKYKPIDTWVQFERLRVDMMLVSELNGVGVEGTDQAFDSANINCAHLTRNLTGKEMTITFGGPDALLGKSNGNKAPTMITKKVEANKLLDKLQRDLENQ